MKTRDVIRHHMARAFFAYAWADQCEETGNAHIMSGKEIIAIMPAEFDPAAWHAADCLITGMESANGMGIDSIFATCAPDSPLTCADFGHYAAMQSMGHGVGLFDYGVTDATRVPYVEFGSHSLQRDYF